MLQFVLILEHPASLFQWTMWLLRRGMGLTHLFPIYLIEQAKQWSGSGESGAAEIYSSLVEMEGLWPQ